MRPHPGKDIFKFVIKINFVFTAQWVSEKDKEKLPLENAGQQLQIWQTEIQTTLTII